MKFLEIFLTNGLISFNPTHLCYDPQITNTHTCRANWHGFLSGIHKPLYLSIPERLIPNGRCRISQNFWIDGVTSSHQSHHYGLEKKKTVALRRFRNETREHTTSFPYGPWYDGNIHAIM